MNKTLSQTMKDAREYTLQVPDITVWVLSKKGELPIIRTEENKAQFYAKECGWTIVAKFRNGMEGEIRWAFRPRYQTA